jgi:hypothetical protein
MSNTRQGLNFRDVDLKRLIVPSMTKGDKAVQTNPLYDYSGNGTDTAPLFVQTPVVGFPWGLSDGLKDDERAAGKEPHYSLAASFLNYKNDALMKDFYTFCTQMQDYAIALAAHNSESWFGEKQEMPVCKALMNKWIHISKDKEAAEKYDPTIKITCRQKKDKAFWADALDMNGARFNLLDLQKKSRGVLKMKLSSYYVINGKFGMTWDLEWIRITELSSNVDRFDFNPNMYGQPLPAPALPLGASQEIGMSSSISTVPSAALTDENTNLYGKRERPTTGGGDSEDGEEEDSTPVPPPTTQPPAKKAAGPPKRAKVNN